MTDEEIIDIRDRHLPSQGEAFDSIAFARDIIAAERERCARICETLPVHGRKNVEWIGVIQADCAAAIRAQKGSE
jgi:hypothetical protein